MTAAIANLALNILMVALLVATIFYCWLLNKRIQVLQDSKSELASVLRHFDESTQRASESIVALQTASKKISENIQTRIDKANFMLDDLAFMIEKGGKLANQMEASVAVGRARSKVMAEQPEEEFESGRRTDHQDNYEDEWDPSALLPESLQVAARAQSMRDDAYRQPPQPARPVKEPVPLRASDRPHERPQGIKEKTTASLTAVLERIGGRVAAGSRDEESHIPQGRPRTMAQTQQDRNADGNRPRSKVEQELLEILRAGVKG